jgi:hypothetical protein
VPHLHTTRREAVVTSADFTALFEGIDLSRAQRLPRWNPPRTNRTESREMA